MHFLNGAQSFNATCVVLSQPTVLIIPVTKAYASA